MLAAIVIDNLFAPNSQWATLNALCEGQETEKAVSVTLVYMTAGSAEEARAIGASLIGRRLAACVNILPGMFSQYHWQGSVQTDEEVVLIAKTRDELVDAPDRPCPGDPQLRLPLHRRAADPGRQPRLPAMDRRRNGSGPGVERITAADC